MLGFVLILIGLLGVTLGLETTSPGTIAAVIKAVVLVNHMVTGQVGHQICTELHRLGQETASCPAP